ncbi:hypothetical protein PoB_002531300 [Plakobranchus ocellatus]|uniref:Uncharacterized protein n=1 Tax=Plakobranchus ocellatus TaxID=259542 RepID=A0AAV3ZVA2_9GAST|nr:hypothetical protein PoB_002531300 [Plakobranchus ocellatus]
MEARANLTMEENYVLNSAEIDVDDEENMADETDNDGDERTAPPTSTTSLSVPEAASYYNSANATIMGEPDNVCSSFSYRQPAQCQ